MKVLKFGGTSVGSIENIKRVKELITDGDKKIVVLSAMSGTTNALVEISDLIKNNLVENAVEKIENLHAKYNGVIDELFETSELKQEVGNYIDSVFELLTLFTSKKHNELLYNRIVSQGELMSTFMFTKYLNQEGVNARLLPALSFMRIDKANEPDDFYIKQNLQRIIDEALPADIYITQGFIGQDDKGNTTTLGREGSDYSAGIIAYCLNAKSVTIWKDVDGVLNADPRYFENAQLSLFLLFYLYQRFFVPIDSLIQHSLLIKHLVKHLPILYNNHEFYQPSLCLPSNRIS